MTITYSLEGTIENTETDFELVVYNLEIPNKVKEFQVQLFEISLTKDINGKEKIVSNLIDKYIDPTFNDCLLKLQKFSNSNKIKFNTKRLSSLDRNNEIDNELENYIKTGTVK